MILDKKRSGFIFGIKSQIVNLKSENPHSTFRIPHSKAGFTLLELLIVIFLIILILGFSTAFFANTLPSSRFNATVREMAATIRQAKHLAQSSGMKQTITIDLDSETYGIDGRTTRDIASSINIKVLDNVSGEVNTGRYRLTFYGTGVSEGGTVVLWNSKKTAKISLDPVMGAVIKE